MASYIVTALLFLLPFVVYPIGINPFEPVKIYTSQILIILLALLTFSKWNREQLLQRKLFIVCIAILVLLSHYHLLFLKTDTTLFGNQFRMQGILLIWFLLLFSYCTSFVPRIRIPQWGILMLLGIQLVAALLMNLTADGRAVGTLGEPNALAAIIIFLWPFLFLRLSTSSFWSEVKRSDRIPLRSNRAPPAGGSLPDDGIKKTSRFAEFILRNIEGLTRRISSSIGLIGLAIALIIILFTGSRSGIIALGIQIAFLFLYRFTKLSVGKIVILILLLFACSLSLPFLGPQAEYENRGEIWKASLIAGYEHPIAGWGFGNTEIALKDYNLKLYSPLRGYYVDSSHNIFLDWWVQGGFIGLSIFITLIYFSFRMFVREKNTLALCLLLGILTVTSFNPVSVATLIHLWWLIGLGEKNAPA